jgi:DDE family transposase
MPIPPSQDPLSPATASPVVSEPEPRGPLPLLEVLAQVPDFRCAPGLRHPLPAILALACAAMLCGARGCQAIAEWGRNYDPDLMRPLGFTHPKTPCPSTLHTVFRQLNWKALAETLRHGSEALLGTAPLDEEPQEPPGNGRAWEGVAIDGKTLGGSRKQGAPRATCFRR